ncbi:HAMP domain-containing sensor histidine kinase [Isoptericola sp. b408]|uniref:sensor histidine kinase n=1 Tax=Isoptericola sp. b408 TaxID=3064653 RepID=UPI002712F549|nr:hybrid sensor histidine kinase/response regulator [Isoptericola sp. b408]MDO8152057.1 hybrid sensor histidine kinase/response regulator [Isoptericola sp. b408]
MSGAVEAAALQRRLARLEQAHEALTAQYEQLSAELEETNSGVVALYAELDERGRQLAAANEAKSRFLRNVSHELRSPVNSIIGLAGLLAESSLDDDQAQQVRFVRDSADTLLTLVDELLELARAEAGHQDVHPAPFDMAELLAELEGTTRPLVRDGVELVVDRPGVPVLCSDRRLVARMLRNLLTNAVKFTERGSVHLVVTPTADGARCEVRDTGLGVPADQIDAIFEEFVQVPHHLQPGARGTGLGLPYARRTAEALGGSLTATSTLGEGSVFTLTLPSLEDAARADAPAGARSGRVGHVLVVDDDHAFGSSVAGLLRDEATRVSVAHDAGTALAMLQDDVDAVVLDVRMPDTTGTALLARMLDERPGLAAVLMSSGPSPAPGPWTRTARFLPKDRIDRAALVAALDTEGTAGP